MLCCAFGSLGVSITLISNFYAMVIGRTIYGLASGIQLVATPRYIEEYIPIHIYTVCFMSFYVFTNIGGLLALFSGILLPPDSEKQ